MLEKPRSYTLKKIYQMNVSLSVWRLNVHPIKFRSLGLDLDLNNVWSFYMDPEWIDRGSVIWRIFAFLYSPRI